MKTYKVMTIICFVSAMSSFGGWSVDERYYTFEINGFFFPAPLAELSDLDLEVYGPQIDDPLFEMGVGQGPAGQFRIEDLKETVYFPRNVVYSYLKRQFFLPSFGEPYRTYWKNVCEVIDDLQVISAQTLGCDMPGFAAPETKLWNVCLYKWDVIKKEQAKGKLLPENFVEYNDLVSPSLIAELWVELETERMWFKTGYNHFMDLMCPFISYDEEQHKEVKELRMALFDGDLENDAAVVNRLVKMAETKRLDVARLLVDASVFYQAQGDEELGLLLDDALLRYNKKETAPFYLLNPKLDDKGESPAYPIESVSTLLNLLQARNTDPNSIMYINEYGEEDVWNIKLPVTWQHINERMALLVSQTTEGALSTIPYLKRDVSRFVYSTNQKELIPYIRVLKYYYGDDICPYLVHEALTTDDELLIKRCIIALRAIASPEMLTDCVQALKRIEINQAKGSEYQR